MTILLLIIILLPLLSFCFIGANGRLYGSYGSCQIAIINMFCSFLLALLLANKLSYEYSIYFELWQWLSVVGADISFGIRYDTLTSVMFIVVTLVSSCVHMYSSVYMYLDPYLSRFMSYLSLFTFFMLVLVSSNNLLVLFLGWEGVGLCSYLLIGFWYTRAQAGKSATKAFLINKIGDLFLLSGISFIFSIFHTIEFSSLSGLLSYCPNYVLDTAALLFFFGAVGKSAQVGLHTWLPDAMEGPTPVSALIHAATMVTAGVFLVIRCSFIFEYTPKILDLISFWGGITALISGSIGTVQNDIKKIIAYSTCSQLGYMIVACGISVYNISLFHLFNHAFFKALLFLSAGSIIHILGDEQDIRKMGGFSSLSPFIYIAMTVASLALAGFPFLSGYYSKDLIIESTISKLWTSQQSIYYLIIISTAFTASYSLRLAEQVFWVDFNGFKSKIYMRASTTIIELLVLLFLAILSIISGYIFRDLFLGFGNSYLADFITKYISTWDLVETEFLNNKIKVIPLILALITVEFESRFLECKWLYNELVNGYLALPTLILSRQYFEQYDKRILELNGPSLLLEFSYSTFTGSKN